MFSWSIVQIISTHLQNHSNKIQLVYSTQISIMNSHYLRTDRLRNNAKEISNTRIDKLFQEFQSLKTRIRSNSSKQKQHASEQIIPSSTTNTYKQFNMDLRRKNNLQTFKESRKDQADYDLGNSTLNCNEKLHIQFKKQTPESQKDDLNGLVDLKGMQMNLLATFQKELNHKLDIFSSKIAICEQMMRGVSNILKMKKSAKMVRDKSRKKSYFSQSPNTKDRSVIKIIQEYQKKIEMITKLYQDRLRQLEKETSKYNDTYSSTAKDSYSKETNQFQSLLLARDNQIGLLKLENSKLRRQNHKLQVNFSAKINTIAQLQNVINQPKHLLPMTNKTVQTELSTQEDEKIKDLNKRIKELQGLLEQKNHESVKLRNSLKKQIQSSESILLDDEELQKCNQDIPSLQIFEASPPELDLYGCKSQILQHRKKRDYDRKKRLEIEIDLVTEQNKNLELKKNFFQNQYKISEQDEQKFQQQSNIFKQQIRTLILQTSILDELSVDILSNKNLKKERIVKLGDHLKCKKLLLEKCSKQ